MTASISVRDEDAWSGEGETTDRSTATGPRLVTTAPAENHVGTTLGRYQILAVLGEGGMGVVYSAYDHELGRKVAIKLVRTSAKHRRRSAKSIERAQSRLLLEARHLAQLSHPNVVAIYDVGELEGDVFLAMEYVRGQTLEDWLRAGPHPSREVFEVMLQVGEGLAAAHEHGLVHCDVKPANVILGEDGVVRVLDFGLSTITTPSTATGEHSVDDDGSSDSHGTDLRGGMAGTPAYMAPEQSEGIVTAHADQFSFCVVLYQALYGIRPFEGATLETRIEHIREGVPHAPVHRVWVPATTRKALLRGLSYEPSRRFPHLGPLLAELRRHVEGRRSSLVVSLVSTGMVGLVALALAVAGDTETRPCRNGDDHWRAHWNAARKTQLAERFAELDPQRGPETWDKVSTAIDDLARTWKRSYVGACRATRVDHRRSEADLDLQVHCLRGRVQRVSMFVDELDAIDRRTLPKLVKSVYGLPDAEACDDLEGLRSGRGLDLDPETRQRIDEAQAGLSRAMAKSMTGQRRESFRQMRALETQVIAADDCQLSAEYYGALARSYQMMHRFDESVQSLHTSLESAIRCRLDRHAARTAGSLMHVQGYLAQQTDLHEQLEAQSMAWIQAAGAPLDLRAHHWSTVGTLRGMVGDMSGDIEAARRAFELAREAGLIEGDEGRAITLNFANVLNRVGQHARAESLYLRLLAIEERLYGDSHPDLMLTRVNLTLALRSGGRIAEAYALARRAGRDCEKGHGRATMACLPAYNSTVTNLLDMARWATALPQIENIRELQRRAGGRGHPSMPWVESYLAEIAIDRGQYRAAIELCGETLERLAREPSAHVSYSATCHHFRATAMMALGDSDSADVELTRARDVLSAKPETRWRGKWDSNHRLRALWRAQNGEAPAAIALLRTILRDLLRHPFSDPTRLARPRLELAGLEASLGDLDAACPRFERVQAAFADLEYGADHSSSIRARLGLADCALARGDHATAGDLYAAVLEANEHELQSLEVQARAALGWARARNDAHAPDAPSTRELLTRAVNAWERSEAPIIAELEQARAWLARLGPAR